jgi:hypothetical protein
MSAILRRSLYVGTIILYLLFFSIFVSIVNPNFSGILKEILKYEGKSLPVRVQGCELCDDRGTEESSGFVVWLLQDGLK